MTFLFDKTVDALVLKAAGYEADGLLDCFAACLFIREGEVKARADTNEIFGIAISVNLGEIR